MEHDSGLADYPEDDDPVTAREEFELDLMEEDASEVGEKIGDEMD